MNHTRSPRYLDRRGYSLVEVMIAAAILGSIVLVATEYTNLFAPNQTSLQRACQSYAQSVVNLMQSQTYYREVTNFMPLPAARTATTFCPGLGCLKAIVSDPNSWKDPAANYVISKDSGALATGAYLQNFQLIQGSMRELTAMYNQNPAIQCAYGTYASLTTPATSGIALPGILDRAIKTAPAAGNGIFIEIRPYLRSTGAANCVATINAMPLAAVTPAAAFAAGSGALVVPPANQNWNGGEPGHAGATVASMAAATKANLTDTGIELSARVLYTENGTQQQCNVTQKFEYPPDMSPPPKPDTLSVITNPNNPPPSCAAYQATYDGIKINVGQTAAGFEQGSQFVCLDLSWVESWTAAPPLPGNQGVNQRPCVTSAGAVDTRIYDSDSPPLGALGFWPDSPQTAFNFGARMARWVPCDKLNQCGKAPASVAFSAAQTNADTGGQVLTLTYNALPVGCALNFATVAVDTAGNMSPVAYLHTGGLNQPTPGEYVAPVQCGALCTWNALWNAGDQLRFPGGYYTCMRSPTPKCCVGAGCTYLN